MSENVTDKEQGNNVTYQIKNEYDDRVYTYRISDNHEEFFVEVNIGFNEASGFRYDVIFKEEEKTLFRLFTSNKDYCRDLVSQLEWQSEQEQRNFMKCAEFIRKSDCPDPLFTNMMLFVEEQQSIGNRQTSPQVLDRLNFDNNRNDLFLELTNKEGDRRLSLCDSNKNLLFEVKSYRDESNAIDEIAGYVTFFLSDIHNKAYEKIKEELSLNKDPFARKILNSIQKIERKEQTNKLSLLRHRLAQKVDGTFGTRLEKKKIAKPMKRIEKAISDKLFGKVYE